MGLEKIIGFLNKNLSYNGIKEISVVNSCNKTIAENVFFDFNFIIYQNIIGLENDINNLQKVIYSLPYTNIDIVESEIEKIAWIKDVIVRKVYPETLSISIEEYSPSAVWRRGSEQYVLDEYGFRIEKIKSNEFQNYFQIKGMGADKKLKNLLDKLHNYPDILNQIDHANFVSRRRWDLHYKNGVRILLPENNITESLSLLDSYIKKNKLIEKGHKKIDLRVEGKITTDRISGNG